MKAESVQKTDPRDTSGLLCASERRFGNNGDASKNEIAPLHLSPLAAPCGGT
jgi:hypothetical protein